MNREKMTDKKRKLIFYCMAYGLLCEVLSLFILGFNSGFLLGISAGTVVILINFVILERVVDIALHGKKILFAFLLQLGRFLLFGIIAIACFKVSKIAVIGYAIGILGFTPAILMSYGKGDGEDHD